MPEYRRLTPENLTEVTEIWRELALHYDHPIGGNWTEKALAEELEAGESWGAFNDNGQLEAFCLMSSAPGVREIRLLATRARVHRTGAMRSLIRSVIEDLAPEEAIWLEVHAGNLPAIGLYEELGFRLQGERKAYYGDGGTALLYEYKPLQ